MPITHITFLIACLAIAGIPPFAGFFSKEEILLAAFHSNKMVFFVALFTSGLTAFYMFRLYFSIFWSKESHVHENGHGEGTLTMKAPLVILAVFAVFAGFFPIASLVTSDGLALATHIDYLFSLTPVASSCFGSKNFRAICTFSSIVYPVISIISILSLRAGCIVFKLFAVAINITLDKS